MHRRIHFVHAPVHQAFVDASTFQTSAVASVWVDALEARWDTDQRQGAPSADHTASEPRTHEGTAYNRHDRRNRIIQPNMIRSILRALEQIKNKYVPNEPSGDTPGPGALAMNAPGQDRARVSKLAEKSIRKLAAPALSPSRPPISATSRGWPGGGEGREGERDRRKKCADAHFRTNALYQPP